MRPVYSTAACRAAAFHLTLVRRALMGHAQAAMTRRYGKEDSRNRRVFPDQALLNAIGLVSYDGLNLEGVKV